MDTLARLIVALVLCLAVGSSWATGSIAPAPAYTVYTVDQGSTRHAQGISQQAACDAFLVVLRSQIAGTWTDTVSNAQCLQYLNGGYQQALSFGTSTQPALCDASSTAVGSPPTSCTCSGTLVPSADGKSCQRPPDICAPTLAKPLTGEVSVAVAGQIVPASICQNSCTYIPASPSGGGGGVTFSAPGFWTVLSGNFTYRGAGSGWIGTGASCTGAPVGSNGPPGTPPTPDPTPPPPGMCRGTVNGAVVTVPCDGTSSSSGTTGSGSGTSGPAGTASSPAGTVPGSGGSQSSTTCFSGTCSTTTTTAKNNSDGTTTTASQTTTTDQATLCKDKPGDPNCAASKSAFGGTCAAATCSGDAVQCQMAKEQAARNCQFFDPTSAQGVAGIAALTAGDTPGDHPRNSVASSTVALSSMIDQTPLFGSNGSCPTDVTVTVAGRPMVIGFSSMCGNLNLLGTALQGLAFLVAAFIVFRKGKA